jgi:hypothetical protein
MENATMLDKPAIFLSADISNMFPNEETHRVVILLAPVLQKSPQRENLRALIGLVALFLNITKKAD